MEQSAAVLTLQMIGREGLRSALKPTMTSASFSNWLHRAIKDRGFPPPIRTGQRACEWSVLEVQNWLASRPRKGRFFGRRPTSGADATA
jgi:predicted DNA-binding transcriptional regulator AlpA